MHSLTPPQTPVVSGCNSTPPKGNPLPLEGVLLLMDEILQHLGAPKLL